MKWNSSLLLCLVMLMLAQLTIAQSVNKWITFKGKVQSASIGTPLDAKLSLMSQPYGSEIRIFTTDMPDGTFSFKIQQGQEYNLEVSAMGYLPVSQSLELTAEGDSVLFELMPSGEGTIVRLDINFKQSKAVILEESYSELNKLLNMLNEFPSMEIQLEGHTDYRGSDRANMRLSEERVEAVKEYLVARDINKKRIKTKAFGGEQPLSRENTPEARLMNRRVEARILKID